MVQSEMKDAIAIENKNPLFILEVHNGGEICLSENPWLYRRCVIFDDGSFEGYTSHEGRGYDLLPENESAHYSGRLSQVEFARVCGCLRELQGHVELGNTGCDMDWWTIEELDDGGGI